MNFLTAEFVRLVGQQHQTGLMVYAVVKVDITAAERIQRQLNAFKWPLKNQIISLQNTNIELGQQVVSC